MAGTSQAQLLDRTPGGKAANTAARAAALGVATHLVTAVGTDTAGKLLCAAFADLRHLRTTITTLSATCEATVLVEPDGERTILFCAPPEGGAPAPAALLNSAFLSPGHDDLTWIDVRSRERRAAFHALTAGGQRGLPAQKLADEESAGRKWEFAVGSLDDTPLPSERLLDAAGLAFCVMTAGAAGGHTWTHNGGWSSWAVPAVTVVDSCGAGDAFLGGMLAALDRRLPLSLAVKVGALAGGLCAGTRGSWPVAPHPSLEDLHRRAASATT